MKHLSGLFLGTLGILLGSLGPPWAPFGVLWASLGTFWVSLGNSWAFPWTPFGIPLALLRFSLDPFWAALGTSWVPLGLDWGLGWKKIWNIWKLAAPGVIFRTPGAEKKFKLFTVIIFPLLDTLKTNTTKETKKFMQAIRDGICWAPHGPTEFKAPSIGKGNP